MHVHGCMHMHVHGCIHVCVFAYMHTWVYEHLAAFVCMRAYMCVCACMRVCTFCNRSQLSIFLPNLLSRLAGRGTKDMKHIRWDFSLTTLV